VKTRVQEGGHNIENDVIRRRYTNGLINLFKIYLPIVNEAMIFDNTNAKAELIAQKTFGNTIEILNRIKFNKLKE
ncbi:zeta toxin, partial [Flavobacterium sp. AJR]